MKFKFGLEVLLEDKKSLNTLKKKRVALICHPASVNQKLEHSFDLLHKKIGLRAAFGPQHGVKGEKQYNMVESPDETHPVYKIPVFSLYGKVRRPTPEMMNTFDVAIFDLQDLGCRIYTFVTTLLYMMQACAQWQKALVVLDRPNPIGREIEGMRLRSGNESFVGAAPMPMRYGLTVGELALYFKDHFNLSIDLKIIKMKSYQPEKKLGYGWPSHLTWINPSPNAPNLNMARIYPGSVMLEGTTLSEGRGTTRALEYAGAPDLDFSKLLPAMKKLQAQWLKGAVLRECFFEPTFYKHQGQICHGFQVHTDHASYNHKSFKPYRLFSLLFKAIKAHKPDYPLFRDFPYEYVYDRLAFDVINGGVELREWIENPSAKPADLEKILKADEASWKKEIKKYYLY